MRKPALYALVMACSGLLMLPCFFNRATAQTVKHYVYSVYFESGKYVLNEDGKVKLDSVVKEVKTADDYSIDIVANTDAIGSMDYNDALSLNRAKATEGYLLSSGIVVNKCKAKGLGKRNPLFDNATENGKAGNRRVDINVTLYKFDNIEQVMAAAREKTEQYFEINNSKENIVTGKGGTVIRVPANAFMLPDGKAVSGKLDFEMKEAFSTNDIFFANLTTTSDGKLLETGGMVYVQASVNGQKVELRPGKSITVAIPAQKTDTSMQLFYAQKNADGSLNWKPTGQKPRQVELKIDLTGLKKIRVPSLDKPQLPAVSQLRMPAYPPIPVKPYMPREPSTIKYNPTFLEKHFRSKEYMAQKEAKLNQPRIDAYNDRMERYYVRVEKYAADTLLYTQVTLPKYYKDSMAYINSIAPVAAEINNYMDDYANYTAAKIVASSLNKYISSAVTSRTRFNFSPALYDNTIVNAYSLVDRCLGHAAFGRRDYVQTYRYDSASGKFKYGLILRDGSVINMDVDRSIDTRAYKLADTLGITNKLDACNRQILEASAKAGALSQGDVEQYIYTVDKMNWINCDHFADNPNAVAVRVNEPDDARVMVKCNNINSYLSANRSQDGYVTGNVPLKTAITIVAVKMKDGHLQMAVKKGVANTGKEFELEYVNCTLSQIRDQLKGV